MFGHTRFVNSKLYQRLYQTCQNSRCCSNLTYIQKSMNSLSAELRTQNSMDNSSLIFSSKKYRNLTCIQKSMNRNLGLCIQKSMNRNLCIQKSMNSKPCIQKSMNSLSANLRTQYSKNNPILIFSRSLYQFHASIKFMNRNLTCITNLRTQNSINNSTHRRTFCLSAISHKKKKIGKEIESESEPQDFIEDEVLYDPEFEYLRDRSRFLGLAELDRKVGDGGVGVMVIQPWIKWGPQMRDDTKPELLLDEAVALVSTIQGINVISKEVVNLKTIGGKQVFGKGTLDRLKTQAKTSKTISCIFVSLDVMKKTQIQVLEEVFGMRVVDRYSVVLAIFQQHAQTKEANLQVALAELPYIRKRLVSERDRLLVMEREKKLKAGLAKLGRVRELVRSRRVKSNLPTVAVVGYTNSGKTSLIRAITEDSRIEGQDQLFATLDVTAHGTRLPCGINTAFIDTVGFIRDLPTDLIVSFLTTLKDAACADVVIHVRDISHPDYDSQGTTVINTLSTLPLPHSTPIITIANKIDKVDITSLPQEQLHNDNIHLVSAATGQGIGELLAAVENEIIRVTGRKMWKFALPTGSTQIQWLRKVTGVAYEEVDIDDPQTTHVIAVMTQQELAAFEKNFASQLKGGV